MDSKIFESRCAKLRTGEFVNDPSVFEYAENAMCEWQQLYRALRTCCSLQKQKIEMLRAMNSALERSLRIARQRVSELEASVERKHPDNVRYVVTKICGGDADDL